jgi:hypothetical protein
MQQRIEQCTQYQRTDGCKRDGARGRANMRTRHRHDLETLHREYDQEHRARPRKIARRADRLKRRMRAEHEHQHQREERQELEHRERRPNPRTRLQSTQHDRREHERRPDREELLVRAQAEQRRRVLAEPGEDRGRAEHGRSIRGHSDQKRRFFPERRLRPHVRTAVAVEARAEPRVRERDRKQRGERQQIREHPGPPRHDARDQIGREEDADTDDAVDAEREQRKKTELARSLAVAFFAHSISETQVRMSWKRSRIRATAASAAELCW